MAEMLIPFEEPVKKEKIQFGLLSLSKIDIPSIQRKISQQLIKNLMMSIDFCGFVEPVIVVPSEIDGRYEVINGQHRVEAMRNMGMSEILAIVVPKHLKEKIMFLNIEKAPNLRDKAHQAFEIYKEAEEKAGDSLEEFSLASVIEKPYYVTLGFITDYYDDARFPCSAFEDVLKKVDDWLSWNIELAWEERIKRAEILMKLKDVLQQRYDELGLNNALYKKVLVNKAFQMIYGKNARKIEDDYYSCLEKLEEALKKVEITSEVSFY